MVDELPIRVTASGYIVLGQAGDDEELRWTLNRPSRSGDPAVHHNGKRDVQQG